MRLDDIGVGKNLCDTVLSELGFDKVDHQRRQPVEQHARRDHAHAFGAHEREVVALGDPRLLQQWVEAFLLDEEDIAEAVLWAPCRVESVSVQRYCWSGSRPIAEILANR